MIKLDRFFFPVVAIVMLALTTMSCDDSKSYAELLDDETKAVNWFLSHQRVVGSMPSDSVSFEVGENAPYYRMDEDGNIYMQVISKGNLDEKAEYNQEIYFRFMRYNISSWYTSGYSFGAYYDISNPKYSSSWMTNWTGEGNADDMEYNAMFFRFGNYTSSSSSQYGSGIQLPLYYLGLDCEVNLVIKSQLGIQDEISYVIPYVYNIRYFKKNT